MFSSYVQLVRLGERDFCAEKNMENPFPQVCEMQELWGPVRAQSLRVLLLRHLSSGKGPEQPWREGRLLFSCCVSALCDSSMAGWYFPVDKKEATSPNYPQGTSACPSRFFELFTPIQRSVVLVLQLGTPLTEAFHGGPHCQDLLTNYTQEEHINEWKCDKCSKAGCVRHAGIRDPPNVLLVHISRLQRGLGPTVTFEKELTVQCESQKGQKTRKKARRIDGLLVWPCLTPLIMNGDKWWRFTKPT